MTVETPHGPARVHLHPVDRPRAALVLGHRRPRGVELVRGRRAAPPGDAVGLLDEGDG